jgi:multiple sugar transport system substrate-binding protein
MKKIMKVFIVPVLALLCAFPLMAGGAQDEKMAPQKVSILMPPTLYLATGGENGVITQFSAQTGIEVEVVQVGPNPAVFEKAMVEFIAKTGRFDVMTIHTNWWYDEFYQYLEPLDEHIAASNPGWNFDDLIKSLVDEGQDLDGNQRTLPFRVGTSMWYHRKDLLQQVGVDVPENWDQVLAASEKLAAIDVYGVGQILEPSNNDYIRYLLSMGGMVLNREKTKCLLDSPEGYRMLEVFSTLYKNGWMPKEVLSWSRDQQIPGLQQGLIAMGLFYAPYWGRLINKEDTENWDKMGWAVCPTEPGVPRGRTLNVGWGLGIDINSKNTEASWELVKALTESKNQLNMALNHANGPTVSSVYQSNEYLEKFPLSKDWLIGTAASSLPQAHPRIEQTIDIYNKNFADVLLGTMTPKAALEDAVAKIDALLQRK